MFPNMYFRRPKEEARKQTNFYLKLFCYCCSYATHSHYISAKIVSSAFVVYSFPCSDEIKVVCCYHSAYIIILNLLIFYSVYLYNNDINNNSNNNR